MEKFYISVLFPIFLLAFSCSMESIGEAMGHDGEHDLEFEESWAHWKKLKKEHGNSYEYAVSEESWTGVGSETTIRVEKGKVIKRNYVAYTVSEVDGSKEISASYEENGKKEVGRHEPGAPAVTMDVLYRDCKTDFLRIDPGSNEIFFETNENGIMKLCGFVPIGCHDDCYHGIRISRFEWM